MALKEVQVVSGRYATPNVTTAAKHTAASTLTQRSITVKLSAPGPGAKITALNNRLRGTSVKGVSTGK